MPSIQTHTDANADRLPHVTRMREGGKLTPTFVYLIYCELDVWMNLVVISDVLLNLLFQVGFFFSM